MSQHDNQTEIVDGALYFVADGRETIKLHHIESNNVNDEGSVSNVNGPSGVIGTQRQKGGFQSPSAPTIVRVAGTGTGADPLGRHQYAKFQPVRGMRA